MTTRLGQTNKQKAIAAVTLVEVIMSIAILALVMAGMIQGYIQTNRRAEWSSLSLAAQSSAAQAVEQAMATKWDTHSDLAGTGFGTPRELQPITNTQTSLMLIPGGTNQSVTITNYVARFAAA